MFATDRTDDDRVISRVVDVGDNKPDLLIHPRLYRHIERWQRNALSENYEWLALEDMHHEKSTVTLIDGKRSQKNVSVRLKPHFDQVLSTGTNINVTSYFFDTEIDMYRVAHRAPRYVIWTTDEPTPVCSTYLDRTDVYGLYEALNRARVWARTLPFIGHNRRESVIVFDLDRTLIDDDNEVLPGALDALRRARRIYDKMILWSHGTSLHVDDNACRINIALKELDERASGGGGYLADTFVNVFDHTLSAPIDQVGTRSCKNLLHLYNSFPETRFSSDAVLVDDSLYNWTPEYSRMFVPIVEDVSSLACLL